jgi:hypothetical protein
MIGRRQAGLASRPLGSKPWWRRLWKMKKNEEELS